MMITEEEVYLGTKKWLKSRGYSILAGQPPRGTDQLPVIEIKLPTGNKGSQYSYKPDLFAFKDGFFYIIECKPSFNYDDCKKIWSALNNTARVHALYEESKQYRLFSKAGYAGDVSDFRIHLRGLVAYGPPYRPQPDIAHIVVESYDGTATFYNDSN